MSKIYEPNKYTAKIILQYAVEKLEEAEKHGVEEPIEHVVTSTTINFFGETGDITGTMSLFWFVGGMSDLWKINIQGHERSTPARTLRIAFQKWLQSKLANTPKSLRSQLYE